LVGELTFGSKLFSFTVFPSAGITRIRFQGSTALSGPLSRVIAQLPQTLDGVIVMYLYIYLS
jgi:hypothetical protein